MNNPENSCQTKLMRIKTSNQGLNNIIASRTANRRLFFQYALIIIDTAKINI